MVDVSVIIPVYNTEAYLAEALDSVVNQTNGNIEIIVVDDRSTDGSRKIIEEYAAKDPRLIPIYASENAGQAVARNIALDIANGDYILFLDSDDILSADCIEVCMQKTVKDNLDFVFFDAEAFSDGVTSSFAPSYTRTSNLIDKIYSGVEVLDVLQKTKGYSASVCLQLISREYMKNRRFEPGVLYEDELFTLPLYLDASRVGFVGRSLYLRRVREHSTMTSALSQKNIDARLFVCEELLSLHYTGFKKRLVRNQVINIEKYLIKQLLCHRQIILLLRLMPHLLSIAVR